MEAFDLGSIVAHIRADTAQFTAAVDEAKVKGAGLGEVMASTGKIIAAGFAVATVAAVGFAAVSLKAYADSEETMAQIKQVLHTTGKEAQISADGVDKIARSMEQYSGKTKDSILQGQIILLQFKQVTSQTLPDFTKAMLDVSQRMGVDAVTAAKTLGIALDDPTVGLSRLKRSGIDFTDAQKEQIKAMQASGDIVGADALLMKSLEERVGGAASAYRNTLGGSLAEVKANFKDFQIVVGQTIAKYLEPLAQAAANALSKIDWQRVLDHTAEALKTFVIDVRNGWDAVVNYLTPGVERFMFVVQEVVKIMQEWFGPSLEALANTIEKRLWPQLMKLWNTIEPGFTEILKALGIIIGVIVVAQVWVFINVLNVLVTIFGSVVHWVELIIGWFGNLFGVIWNAVRDLPHNLSVIIDSFKNVFYKAGQAITQGLVQGIKDDAGKVFDAVKNLGDEAVKKLKGVLKIFSPSQVFHEIGMNVGQGLINGMNAMQNDVGMASGSMAMAAVAPASSIINNASNSSTVNTSINGPINIASNADANKFLQQLTYNQELAMKGITPVK